MTSRWEPNGDFPEAGPNPFLEENRRMLMEQVKAQGVDLGIAWDGDADRCFFIETEGLRRRRLRLRAARRVTLAKQTGATVLYDLRASWGVPDTVGAAGGKRT